MTTSSTGHLYFHAPCFDGIVSAVLIWDFLEKNRGWRSVRLHAVNYEVRARWLAMRLGQPCAVVDFLYHPRATVWADHHLTTFLTGEVEAHFRGRDQAQLWYSPTTPSCAEVIWRRLRARFGYRNERYRPLLRWAAKLDAAKYRSVNEAVFARSAALQIARTLALGRDRRHSAYLVRQLKSHNLEEVASAPRVRRLYEEAERRLQRGLAQVRESLKVGPDGIVTFDVDATDALINRYLPYVFAPRAPYVAGIIRDADGVKVTAMRNPWLEAGIVPLGRVLEQFGGGGHQDVGSVILRGDRAGEASQILRRVVAQIRETSEGPTKGWYDRAV